MLHPSEATYRLSEVWFPQHEWSLSSNTSSPSAHIYNYSSKRKLIPSIQRYLSRLVLNCHWQFSLVFNFSHYFCRCPQIAISTLRFYKTLFCHLDRAINPCREGLLFITASACQAHDQTVPWIYLVLCCSGFWLKRTCMHSRVKYISIQE